MARASKTIGVIGENLVDLFVDAAGSVRAIVGGGPFNVARSVARLGFDATFISGISDDAFGRIISATLHNEGVRTIPASASTRPTAMALVELERGIPRYGFHLTDAAAFDLDKHVIIKELTSGGHAPDYLYFGTLGLLIEPMASIGEELIMSSLDDVVVVIDPNCRPGAVPDEAQFRARLNRLFTRADIVKVSTEDLDYLASDSSHEASIAAMLDAGTTCVIVTNGPHNVDVHTATDTQSIDVPWAPVVDTVGAGDALVGGLLAWWSGHGFGRGEVGTITHVVDAVQAAISVSVSTCTRSGAEPPWQDEMLAAPGWEWLSDYAKG